MGVADAREPWTISLRRWLQEREDAAGLAAFRVFVGLLLAWEAWRYLDRGWPARYFVKPDFIFKYYGFEWVQPLPEAGMNAVYWLMVGAGIVVALGYRYRIAATVLWLAHTYVFLLAAERYLNHEYLICLLTFVMIWLPADRAFALRPKAEQTREVAKWPRAVLRAQVGLVYVFGGIAKINADWMNGVPIRQWLGGAAKRLPWAADILRDEFTISLVCWGGMFFDLFVIPLLLWRRTRWLAVIASVAFHLTNATIFKIGVFPYLMLAATTLFLRPDWPRLIPGVERLNRSTRTYSGPAIAPRSLVYALGAWFSVQLFLPVRHHLYPGDVAWTEEGHYFAWRMKLRSKRGKIRFVMTDPESGRRWKVNPADAMRRFQVRKMAGNPALIIQYAHHLADTYEHEHGVRPEVRAQTKVSLNYRDYKPLVDPEVNLAEQPWTLAPDPWLIREP